LIIKIEEEKSEISFSAKREDLRRNYTVNNKIIINLIKL